MLCEYLRVNATGHIILLIEENFEFRNFMKIECEIIYVNGTSFKGEPITYEQGIS